MSAWALGNHPVPPFMLATVRALIVVILLAFALRWPRPQNFGRLLIICALVGPIHLGFLYTGLQTAPASAGSILAQILVPIATVLSVIMLKEQIGWRRTLAIIGAFVGVMIMVFDRESLSVEIGLIYLIGAYFAVALASILMKQVGDIPWQQYVAWMAVMLFICSGLASLLFETGQVEIWQKSRMPLLITASYAAICVSIIAHGQYFSVVKKYEISQVVPLTMTQPIFATILGVSFLGEVVYPRYWIGAALILPCVYIIATRTKA